MHARGTVDGTPAVAVATGATRLGGAIGVPGCRRIVEAIDVAVRGRVAMAGIWHSGGVRPGEGVDAPDTAGQVLTATDRPSGRIPQLAIELGPVSVSAACSAALTDTVVMSGTGRIFPVGATGSPGFATRFARLTAPENETPRAAGRSGCPPSGPAVAGGRAARQHAGPPAGRAGPGGHRSEGRRTPADPRPARRTVPGAAAPWAPNVVTALGHFAGRTRGGRERSAPARRRPGRVRRGEGRAVRADEPD
ncbi:carboxyl transferase domain-containing protein [Actinoplanes teichomyceticus]|uniref:carboxyl transferase domain-containing protein n=1 Tax=Actinoplanes teichomyceticus TaxID=1867 RepID=UPI00370976C5